MSKLNLLRLCVQAVIVAMLLCVVTEVSVAQAVSDTSGKQQNVHIDHADVWNGRVIDTVDYLHLTGDVQLSQDGTFMYCDSAVIINKKEVFAYGNVIIQKGDSLTIYADTLKYHSDSLHAELLGNVLMESNEDQLWTSHLEYDLENDVAYYYESAIMINDSTQVSSNIGYFWSRTSRARFIDSVVVIGSDVTLLADSLDYNTDTQIAEFVGPTLIIQEDARIYCEDGFYDVPGKTAEFRENAKYVNEEQKANADTIKYDGAAGLVYMIGNAHFEEEDMVVDSDTIRFYEETGETHILGSAVFTDSSRHVVSDRIEYNRNTEKLKTLGRSVLTEGPQELTADTIDFDQGTGFGYAYGNVIYYDTAAQTILECDSLWLDKNTEFIQAYGPRRPVLRSVMETDTMHLTADTLQFLRVIDTTLLFEFDTVWLKTVDTMSLDSFRLDTTTYTQLDTFKRFEGYHDVRLFKGTMQGLCDSLVFNDVDSIFHMLGNPILWSDTTQFIADTIQIELIEGRIDKIHLIDNCLVISMLVNLFYNQIQGKRMLARFIEGELQDLYVNGNAESIYYAQDENNGFVGVNRIVSSELFFTFSQKQLEGIRLYGQPVGTMTPMIDVDHGAMRLDGFKWLDNMRPRTLDDLF